MTSMPTWVYALLTTLTALIVATILIPLLRVVLAPLLGVEPQPITNRLPAAAGSASVLLAVVALIPMGGDGLVVAVGNSRLALGMLLALGLLVLGTTRSYRRLEARQRLWLQAGFAVMATLVGLLPSGVSPAPVAHATGVLILLVSMNTLGHLDSLDGLAAGSAALATAFLALIAQGLGAPEWSDLNLGLCGALLALLAFNLAGGRFRAELGAGGGLAVGFLLGVSLLALSEQAVPGSRPFLALPLALPFMNLLVVVLGRGASGRPFDDDRRDRIHELLLDFGLTSRQVLALSWTLSATTGLAALRLLDLLP
ncbi:MAG: hypothetical protein ACE5G2_05655 [Candidatus Krumholzibacteriia bacterium]